MTLPHVVDVSYYVAKEVIVVVVVVALVVEFEAVIAVATVAAEVVSVAAIVAVVAMQFDHNVTIDGECISFVVDVAPIGWI